MFIARTPRSSSPPTRRRAGRAAGRARSGSRPPLGSGPLPSIGSPKASTTRPSQLSSGNTSGSAFRHFRLAAKPDAVEVAQRHQKRAPIAEARLHTGRAFRHGRRSCNGHQWKEAARLLPLPVATARLHATEVSILGMLQFVNKVALLKAHDVRYLYVY